MLSQMPYPSSDHQAAKSPKGTSQTGLKKRRQSILAETTNYPHCPGQWTPVPQAPVFADKPMEGVIPASLSVVTSHQLYGLPAPSYGIPAQPQVNEAKRVRFDNPIAVSQELEEDLEYSDCMQRRLEQDIYYPCYPGYANQGGMVLAPPMQIPGFQGHSGNIRWSGVPIWAPGMSVQHSSWP